MTKATEHALSKEFFSEHCWLTCVLILAKTFTDHIGLHVDKTNCPVTVLQEGGPLPGPETRLLSNKNELFEETHVLTKQEILLERAPGWRTGG